MFSIIIPTWNNLEFLKLCIDSIRKHSQLDHEIIIHVNDGADGTLDWVRQEGLKYSHSQKNIGVCLAVNHLAAQASHDWVLFLNDDMIACPGWDTAFTKAIQDAGTDLALFCGTLIQISNGKNPLIIEQNFGSSAQDYDEPKLLREYMHEHREDAASCESQPTLFHRKWWAMIGGYSLEFSPGMSSDNDLVMKFWMAGCRHFRTLGDSRFYHFACKSTGRIRKNKGGREFLLKWGVSQKTFQRHYLNPAAQGAPRPALLEKLRRAIYSLLHRHPLEDMEKWDAMPGQEPIRSAISTNRSDA